MYLNDENFYFILNFKNQKNAFRRRKKFLSDSQMPQASCRYVTHVLELVTHKT